MASNHEYAGIAAGSFIKTAAECRNYCEYRAFLGTQRTKRLAANVVVWLDRDVVVVQLYTTDILRYYPTGFFSANNGGYTTITTTTRLNQFGPRGVDFWHHKGKLMCSLGPCGHDRFYPAQANIEPSFAEVYNLLARHGMRAMNLRRVYPPEPKKPPPPPEEEPIESQLPHTVTRKKRTIRKLIK